MCVYIWIFKDMCNKVTATAQTDFSTVYKDGDKQLNGICL